MDLIVNATTWLHEGYLWTYTIRDKRMDGLPFMNSVKPTLACLAMYYTMVIFGPKIMKDRQPFNLKWLLIVYNIFITVLNAFIFWELAVGSARLHYSWFCQPFTQSTDVESLRIAWALYLYFLSKLIEFCDTLFFIMRKKNNQLSFLHMYHHSTMFFFWWMGCRWCPGGSAWLGPMVNAFIHVLMYSYYALSAFGPYIRKFLWWKQYLTILQLVQFTGGLVLGINGILTGCTFIRWMQYLLVIYMLSFMVLFGNFYKNAYNHGLRAAYRMEMSRRVGIDVAPSKPSINGPSRGRPNDEKNGHVASSMTSDTLRSRTSILTNNILTEEVAPHLAKHSS